MKHKKLKLSVLLLGLGLTGLHAQEAIVASGGNASGSGGSVSYSLGQIAYTTNTGTGGSVSQGVQQPYEIFTVGVEQIKGITLQCSAYPNPTKDYLTLKVEGDVPAQCIASLFDINGKLLEEIKVVSNETLFSMDKLAVGSYFLRVTLTKHDSGKEINSFKIIKN